MEKTVCELFAGVGGFRLGLERQNKDWDTVWFNQYEPNKKNQWAHDCYLKHYGYIDQFTNIDINEVNKENIPNHNLLVGGFPCQDYSVARCLNGQEGIKGKKGVLWWSIMDVLLAKSPPFVLLENVDRLLKSPSTQRGRDFGIILSCFAKLGYDVEWRVVNAASYGAAQRRRRVFIFAYKTSTKFKQRMNIDDKLDIITKDGFFCKAFPISECEVLKYSTVEYNYIQNVSDNYMFEFENAGYMSDGEIYTVKVLEKRETTINLCDVLEKVVDEKYYLGQNISKWEYLKNSKKINRISKTGHEYIYSEGAVPFPDFLDRPSRTMLTSESTCNRSSHVVMCNSTNKLRVITPLESERLNGFDDNWTNTGMTERMRYFCMGNALVVPMITRMAKVLECIFDNE